MGTFRTLYVGCSVPVTVETSPSHCLTVNAADFRQANSRYALPRRTNATARPNLLWRENAFLGGAASGLRSFGYFVVIADTIRDVPYIVEVAHLGHHDARDELQNHGNEFVVKLLYRRHGLPACKLDAGVFPMLLSIFPLARKQLKRNI